MTARYNNPKHIYIFNNIAPKYIKKKMTEIKTEMQNNSGNFNTRLSSQYNKQTKTKNQ